jgi:hypothetical protein
MRPRREAQNADFEGKVMVEKIKAINNPLTIVAIFAALSEIAGTAALAAVDKSLQQTFIWFVMGFPFSLLVLFFATLNFNPMVLYAPSDFQNEENFLKNIQKKTQRVSEGIERVTQELVDVKDKLTSSLEKVAGDDAKDLKSITENLSRVETELSKVRQKANLAARSAFHDRLYIPRTPVTLKKIASQWNPRTDWRPRTSSRGDEKKARRAIRRILGTRPEGSTLDQILKDLKESDRDGTVRWLSRMGGIGLVTAQEKEGQTLYRLAGGTEPRKVEISA